VTVVSLYEVETGELPITYEALQHSRGDFQRIKLRVGNERGATGRSSSANVMTR
jgi:hypothetical protein